RSERSTFPPATIPPCRNPSPASRAQRVQRVHTEPRGLVKLHLVRHAKAARRSRWSGPEALRPLTEPGRVQARAIAEVLAKQGVARLLSSPAARCRQTLVPLAEESELAIEVDERLAEGADPAKAFEWLAALRGDTAVCSHGELVSGLLERFRAEGAEF